MIVAAGLYGLTLKYDYWSNAVEFLAVSAVLAGGVFDWHWGYLLALGLVFGTGRETIPFLALVGTPQALALSAGAAISHLGIRWIGKVDPSLVDVEEQFKYGKPMWASNIAVATQNDQYHQHWEILCYLLVAALAAFTAPLLTLLIVAVTFYCARIDEPRVLTPLVPFAAMTVIRCL